jgi:hypothetical protein
VNPSPTGYPEDLDAGLLKIAGVCVLAAVMASLDTTVVSVAQRTFITEFHTTQAVVAWTMTGNTLALATVIPLTGWAADRFGTRRARECHARQDHCQKQLVPHCADLAEMRLAASRRLTAPTSRARIDPATVTYVSRCRKD